MNVKFKFIKIWICLVIIFLSFVNGNHQPPGRIVVKIEEDPLVDKITKVNHNFKLVKLKKVKKIYTSLPDEEPSNDLHLSKRPTIVDLNTKNNIVTQTPISFLKLDKQIKNNQINELKNNLNDDLNKNLIGNKLLDELIRDSHKLPNDLINNKLPDNLKEKNDQPNDLKKDNNLNKNLKINKLNNGFNKIRDNEKNNDQNNDQNNEKNNDQNNNQKNERSKSIKKLFQSINKFKQLNLNKLATFNKSTSINPFASSSNKSTLKTEFLNKITTKKTISTTAKPFTTVKSIATSKPILNQTKKFATLNSKIDKYKTTTTESPRTFTYKQSKRTTTYTPYIYSTTTSSTIEPIFRIRKSKSTTKAKSTYQTNKPVTNQINKPTTSQTTVTTTYIITTDNPFLKKKFIDENEIKNDKQTTSYSNVDKSDLEPHNSSRKYAKLFLNNRKSNEQTTPSFIKYTTKYQTTSRPITSTRSYLRTNSRIATFSSYLPSYTDYTTISPIYKQTIEATTESQIKNEISKDKLLTASRKRPIYKYRPRTVKPNQLAQLTTPLPKLETTTQNPIWTTAYSPRFRSTTKASSINYLNQFRTTSLPILKTNELKYKEYKLKKNLDLEDKITELPIRVTLNELPIRTITELPIRITESPATSRFYNDNKSDSKNDLENNLITRKSKWILKDEKGVRQKKSDSPYTYSINAYTKPIRTSTIGYTEEPTTIRPVTYVTTINSIQLKNKLNMESNNLENEIPESKIIDRAPKSLDNFYQMRRPEPFLISKNKNEPSSILNLKYEEPKRNTDVKANEINDPDKEIYYKDTKVRKESKLVPQTYFYSTSAPSLNELNDRLSYLNEEKLKYQRPFLKDKNLENKKYEKPINLENKPSYEEPELRYSNLPINLPYRPPLPNKYQNTIEEKPLSYLENENKSPYIKSHFNLGRLSNDIPKYGSVFKVGKLSKPFSNQAPLPFFQSDSNSKNNLNNYNQNYPELSRLPIKNKSNKESEEHVNRVVDLRPFDFKNYQPLPNTKFIRTDLESENLDKHDSPTSKEYENQIKNTQYKPIKYIPINNKPTENYYKPIENSYQKSVKDYHFNKPEVSSYNIDLNQYNKQKDNNQYRPPDNINYNKLIDHNQNRPIENKYSKQLEYNKPLDYNKPIEYTQPPKNIQSIPNVHLGYNNHNNKLDLSPPSDDKNIRFNINRVPAKVVYDRYNQKFTGPINLKPVKYPPTPKHYAEIPDNIYPIEYQRKPPIIKPVKPERPIYKSIYDDYNNYPINKPIYNTHSNHLKPNQLNYQINYQKPNQLNYPTHNYKPNQLNNYPIINKDRLINYPINKPIYNTHLNNHLEPNQLNYPIDQKPPYPIYKDEFKPIYTHPNYMPKQNNNLNYLNRYEERDQPVYYDPNQPIYFNQFINHDQTNQFKPQENSIKKNQKTNAGHYDNRIYLKPTKDVKLINLNDITPNLSLFKKKIPDFQLLQNTVISHDIPIAENYNLKKK